MYSVSEGLLLKFDWNYASQTKDSMGLTISLNKEINKTFTLFTSLILLWKDLCNVVILQAKLPRITLRFNVKKQIN